MFYLLNQKFETEARKAVFSELSMQLEFACEDLTLDTETKVFDEMIEIINELKVQATSHRVSKMTPPAVDPMQKFKDLPISIKIETPDEVKF